MRDPSTNANPKRAMDSISATWELNMMTSGCVMKAAPDEQRAETKKQKARPNVHGLQRQSVGKRVAEEYDRAVGEQHAEGGAGDDQREIRVSCGQGHRGDLSLIADLCNEEGDQGRRKSTRPLWLSVPFIQLVGFQAPKRHRDHADADDQIQTRRREVAPEMRTNVAGDRMIGESRAKNAGENGPGFAVVGGQHQGE